MKKTALLAFLMLALHGCADMQQTKLDQQRSQLVNYMQTNRPLVDAGQLPWSNYYRGIYDIYQSSNFTDRGFMMQALAGGIDKAQQFESGKITAQEFDTFRLKLQGDITTYQDTMAREDRNQQARDLESAQAAQQKRYQPRRLEAYQLDIPKPVNCTSNRVGDTVYTNCY